MMDLNKFGAQQHQININNGWDVFHHDSFPITNDQPKTRFLLTHMALVHSEVAEATEAVRKRDLNNFAEEMADTVLRVASICHGLGIDLDAAAEACLIKNRGRGIHHGGKAV